MAGDGTSFEIDLSGVKGAEAVTAAADGVVRLSSSLEAAVASATAAADAVKTGEAAYKQAENAANKASLALEKIGIASDLQATKAAKAASEYGVFSTQYQKASDKLQALNARQTEAAAKAAAATTAMNAQAASLDKMKLSATGASAGQAQIAKALDVAKAKAAAATKSIQAAGKPIDHGAAAGALGKLGGPLGSLGQKAFDAADAFKKMGSSLGGAGPYVAVAVGIVAIVTAVAAVSAAVLVGIGGITAWAIKLADTDGVLKKLTDRATTGFKKIFSGLNIKPLLAQLEKVADLFDEGSASAKAIKVVFESLFQPIVDGITAWVPKMVSAFIQFQILVLKALIAIKPFGSTILEVGKWIGIVALVITGVLAVAIGVLIAGVAAMAVGFAVGIAILAAVAAGVIWLGLKFSELGGVIFGALKSAWDFLSGLSLTGIGTAMIDGLIAGITGAAGGVLKAMTGAVSGAIDGAKSLLGIASPSKVFAEIGTQTGAGMVEGVDGSAGEVQGALESMAAPPDVAAAGGSVTATASGAGNVFNIVVHAAGSTGQAIGEAVKEAIEDLLTQTTGGTPGAA